MPPKENRSAPEGQEPGAEDGGEWGRTLGTEGCGEEENAGDRKERGRHELPGRGFPRGHSLRMKSWAKRLGLLNAGFSGMRPPGFEPGLEAWGASVLTTRLRPRRHWEWSGLSKD